MAGLIPSGNLRELPPDIMEHMAVDGLGDDDEGGKATNVVIDAKTGAHIIYQTDGSAIIDTQPDADDEEDNSKFPFDGNLATKMSESDLASLGAAICEGVEADLKTREDFENIFSRAIDLLGIKLEESTGSATGDGTVSRVYHPLLLETTVRYQANFVAEMLPADGPAKVKDDQPEPLPGMPPEAMPRDELAEAFEKDINHYLTNTATEFYPDTDKMAFSQGLFGNGFKKQFHCPLRRRPVSESIPMQDFIVSNNTTDLTNALRITHRTKMSRQVMIRMQLNKTYRKVDVGTPNPTKTTSEQKIGSTEGTDVQPQLPSDFEHTIYETLVDIDLKGFEHTDEDGELTGLPLPYKVTVEKDSQVVLAVRRNWEEDDEEYQKKLRLVHFPLIPGLGFYAYGFIQLLGNTSRALTGITRMLLDAGMFASYPGFVMQKGGSKQATTELRVMPGMAKEIDTNGKDIREVLMAVPYKEPSATLEKMREDMGQDGLRLGGAAQIPVGEGRVDVPVGTMMAAVEQLTKVMGAVHKRNHTAQQQELRNLRDLFKEDPTALWRFAKSPARKWEIAQEFADLELVPASDPNVPSHVHRIMVATALIQLAGSPAGMQIYDQKNVHERALRVIGINDTSSLFMPPVPPGAPPPDPMVAIKQQELELKKQDQGIKQTELQRKAQDTVADNDLRQKELAANLANDEKNRQHEEKMEQMKLGTEHIKQQSQGIAAIAKEHVAGINAKAEAHVAGKHALASEHLKGLHQHAQLHTKAALEAKTQERQHKHEKETAAEAAKVQKATAATAAKAKPKPATKTKPKKGK